MTVPARIFINVDLPAPFGPSSPNISPLLTFRLIFFKAWIVFCFVLYSFERLLISSAKKFSINIM